MNKAGIPVIALVTLAALAGCASPSGPQAGTSTLQRHMALQPDSTSFGDPSLSVGEDLARSGHAWFDLHYGGTQVSTADVTVEYLGVAGAPRIVALSTLTSQAALAPGDVVRLAPEDMSLVSSMTLRSGSHTLAARGGTDRGWFTAAGLPLPLASSLTGTATWSLHGSGGFDASAAGIPTFSGEGCGPTGCNATAGAGDAIDSLQLRLNYTVDGSYHLGTEVGPSTRVSLTTDDLQLAANVDFAVVGKALGEPLDIRLKGSCLEDIRAAMDFGFATATRELELVGSSGSVALHGDLVAEGLDHDGPACAGQQGLPTSQRPLALTPAPDTALGPFLQRMWGLDLAPGDEFTFHATSPGVTLDYVSQVLAQESRSVGGVARPVLKSTDSLVLMPSSNETIRYDETYWVDAVSYLPVFRQSTFSRTVQAGDQTWLSDVLAKAFGASGSDALPPRANITLSLAFTSELTSFSGDAATAGLMALGASRGLPILVASLAGTHALGAASF